MTKHKRALKSGEIEMTQNTEHRVVVHRDGGVPGKNHYYCVVFVGAMPRIAFHDGDRWIPSDGEPIDENDINSWFYAERIDFREKNTTPGRQSDLKNGGRHTRNTSTLGGSAGLWMLGSHNVTWS